MPTKAKLLLFSHVSSPKSITGAEKFLLLLAANLSRYFEAVLIAPEEGELTSRAGELGIRTLICRYPSQYTLYAPGPDLPQEVEQLGTHPAFAQLVSLILQEQADLILTNTCVNVLPAMAAASLSIPVIWNVTEVIVRTPYIEHSMNLLSRLSSRIIAISETVLGRLREYIPAEKLGLLYPSWEPAQFHPESWEQLRKRKRAELKLTPEHRLVGFISSFLTEGKGLAHFVEVALSLCEERPEVRVLVIGQKSDRTYYKRCLEQVNESKYYSRFTFIPFEKSVESAYCAMDVLVIPSVIPEGFGLTALEGMLFGKLTAAYDAGGLSEVLGACGFGPFIADCEKTEELALKVKALLDLPAEQAAVLSETSRVLADANFGPAVYAQRLQAEVALWSGTFPDRLRLSEEEGGIVVKVQEVSNAEALPIPVPELASPLPGRVVRRSRLMRRNRRKKVLKRRRSKSGLLRGRRKKKRVSHLRRSAGRIRARRAKRIYRKPRRAGRRQRR